jgi:hypothetical protein
MKEKRRTNIKEWRDRVTETEKKKKVILTGTELMINSPEIKKTA